MSSQQSGLVAGNAQNEAGGTVPRNRSRFPLSESFFTTERFADYNPCFVMEAVSGDKITLNQPHQVRTYTLKAPLLQNILKKKDYFQVPMQAILPLNWEKFYTNPVIGDDVPLGVGTGVPNFWGRLVRIFDSDLSALVTALAPASTETDVQKLTRILKFIVFYEMFYSNGCLMKNLRIGSNAYLPISRIVNSVGGSAINRDSDFDELFDVVIRNLQSSGSHKVDRFNITIGSKTYDVELTLTELIGTNNAGVNPFIGIRECLELLRDDLVFTINSVSVTGSPFGQVYTVLNLFSVNTSKIPVAPIVNPDYKTQGVPLNLARLWAYQLVVAHYYSNDHIDVLYSAELYREYIRSLYLTRFSSSQLASSWTVFIYNGVKYEFDALSAWYFNMLFCGAGANFSSSFVSLFSLQDSSIAYFVSLFGFKKSLRFMDYFTGSRSRPLAIGDANVDTSGSQVGVLDIARKFQATRFYNAINRSGRKFSAYMQELFGIVPKPDYHNPFYLAHTSDVVGSEEVQNTGDYQFDVSYPNSITSILRSNAARYAFSFEPDRDCVIIGISYYDLPRVYTRATERQNFYLDRMDMFNPFMQYIGDQPIFNAELGTPSPDLQPFSYTNRDMEYKQRFNMSAGGFCAYGTQLDKWFFPADVLRRWFGTNIGSSFIRSFNSEFDRFYLSLTGFSLGTYFHFIVRYDDRCDASRPMAYAPGIMQ